MADLTKIQFVHEDSTQIIAEMKSDLEIRLNRQIAPSDVEMLLVQAYAYRELLLRSQMNDTARQNLVAFSRGAALEYLAQLVGVFRLPASGSRCTVQFNMVEGHTGIVIPEALRVQSMDGKVVFQTIEERVVPAGTFTTSITAVCSTAGTIGNGYALNTINIILDPQAFISTAQNITVPIGGADDETDEELRERIKLAPASYSVAGPDDAYKFHAKSASPSIVDVAITSPEPGTVKISPLLKGGELPTQDILDTVQAICNGQKIRPLTDTVLTAAPTIQEYSIAVELTLLNEAVTAQVINLVTASLTAFVDARKNRLGVDILRNKISALSMIEGKIYNVNVVSPVVDIVATDETYTKCTGISVIVTGTHDE